MVSLQRLPGPARQQRGGPQFPEYLEGQLSPVDSSGNLADLVLTASQIPAVLFYQRIDSASLLDFSSLPLSTDTNILCQDITISRYALLEN